MPKHYEAGTPDAELLDRRPGVYGAYFGARYIVRLGNVGIGFVGLGAVVHGVATNNYLEAVAGCATALYSSSSDGKFAGLEHQARAELTQLDEQIAASRVPARGQIVLE